jgi:hypothetical protein
MRDIQEPTEKPGIHAGWNEHSKEYEHPAFGAIRASRTSGSAVLHGSDFLHQHYVTISINRAVLARDLSRDWHFPREELVEVQLSEAQWATFVSSMNVGSGVPCTISHVAGKTMPGIPLRVQRDEFQAETDRVLSGLSERVQKAIDDVEGEIGAGLSRKKRDAILNHLNGLRSAVGSTLPFVAKSFEEHMESTVEKAKIEVNAYVQASVNRAGLAALNAAQESAPLSLPLSTQNSETVG